jgi:hypothetical protein
MSEDTARQLAEAQRLARELRAKADAEIDARLSAMASELRDRLDEIAKRTAQKQPEVTKALGSDGIKTFRAELAEEAQVLADDLRSAAGKIKWPRADSDYANVTVGNIHSALFEYMHGSRVDRLAAVFRRNGFDVGEHRNRQSLILPQSLYREKDFEPVAEALNAAGEANRAAASAKAADDEDIVASLWSDSDAVE